MSCVVLRCHGVYKIMNDRRDVVFCCAQDTRFERDVGFGCAQDTVQVQYFGYENHVRQQLIFNSHFK